MSLALADATAEDWAERVRPHMATAVESIVATGMTFIQAKAALPHGEFGRLAELVGMHPTTVQRFMAVAEHQVLANPAHVQHLPASWGTLAELARIAPAPLTVAIEAGEVTPSMERKQATQLAARLKVDKPRSRPAPGRPTHTDDPDGPIPSTFAAIVVDPPWRYENTITRGAAEDHYPTMSLDELADLELPAEDNAHLYLWVTNGFLREAFDLIDAWGFTYKACLTWCKPQIGMGNYFRNSTEHVYFAVRGSLATTANNVPTWFTADRTRHSAKPECFYDLVEKSSPGPRLEMFARRRRLGWHTWGNEA